MPTEGQHDLLLEVLSEEIPSRMQRRGGHEFMEILTKRLLDAGLESTRCDTYTTPRRLSVVLGGLPSRSGDVVTERRGPRASAPPRAVEGFARSVGVPVEKLELRRDRKDTFHFATVTVPGRQAADILATEIPRALAGFRWPKSMRWGSGPDRWVRPVHSILCVLLDEQGSRVVDFKFAGVESGNWTVGNTAMVKEGFRVSSVDDYLDKLQSRFVIPSSDERRRIILERASRLAADKGLTLVEDESLLEEVSGLVEWPKVMMGEVDRKFSSLPEELLVTSMRSHQKYLAAKDREIGRISHFVVVSNRETSDDGETILNGNERVLKARLEDASFAWTNDLQRIHESCGPERMVEALDGISFHGELGSLGSRAVRMTEISAWLADHLGVRPQDARLAARIAKMDLVSQTVGEFPELQGVIGRYLAYEAGFSRPVADACEDHYYPSGPVDRIPTKPVAIAVGLADRMDQMIGFIGIGLMPTGSRDPFAVRRSALGMIRLLLENRVRVSLRKAFLEVAGNFERQGVARFSRRDQRERIVSDAIGFVHARLKIHLRSEGYRHDVLTACIATGDSDDLTYLVRRADALTAMLGTSSGKGLIEGFRRANNIVEAEMKRGALPELPETGNWSSEPAERRLFDRLVKTRSSVEAKLGGNEDLDGAMEDLASLRTPIDDFFDTVRVNVDDEHLRRKRLGLLLAVRETARLVADLAHIET